MTTPKNEVDEKLMAIHKTKRPAGCYYGTPRISSIIATFEAGITRLINNRKFYKPNSKALEKYYDSVRLEMAQSIADLLTSEKEKAVVEARIDEVAYWRRKDWSLNNAENDLLFTDRLSEISQLELKEGESLSQEKAVAKPMFSHSELKLIVSMVNARIPKQHSIVDKLHNKFNRSGVSDKNLQRLKSISSKVHKELTDLASLQKEGKK